MDVELREITSDTVRGICELTVPADQRLFVAPNAVSIAEAHFTPGHWMRAIYADGQPAGFVLTFDDALEGYFLWRFMIAHGHQRRGIGRGAMQQVIEHWRELGATAARTSVVPSNTGASRLYESLGFRLTGAEEHGELVMSLELEQPEAADSRMS
jgi:diamine N-acetyltransferase